MAPHSGRVNAIDVTRDARALVTGGGKQVVFWDAGTPRWTVAADAYEVSAVRLHSTGCVLSTGSSGALAVLEGADGAVRHRHELEQPGGALFELPDGRVVVGLEEYEDLILLDPATGAREELAQTGEQSPAIDFRVAGSTLRSFGASLKVASWDLATRAFLGYQHGPEGEGQGFVGDDRALTTTEDHAIIWSIASGAPLHTIALSDLRGGVASADGARVALRAQAGVTIVDTTTGALTGTFTPGPWPRLAVFSPDGARLAVVADQRPNSTLALYDLASGAELTRRQTVRISALRWAAGTLLLGLEDGSLEHLSA